MPAHDFSKMGTAKVMLFVNQEGHHVIEKYPASDVEYDFYHHAANELNHADIATPELLFAEPAMRKLGLEYIPHQIDQDAVAGNEALTILSYLHDYPSNPEWIYHDHSWSDLALEQSLTLLALPFDAARQLRCFHRYSDALFYPQSLISGDSNAGNWGRRDNGELVLFDWERFGMGSPAIDLAPLVKGMGTKQIFIDLAERYCRISGHYDVNDLARKIAIAKAWIVTEVVTLLNERQKVTFPHYLNWYRKNLPGWLDTIVKML